MTEPPLTVHRALERAAARPDRGLRFLDRRERETRITWDEIARRATRVAGRLRAQGVQPGDRVALVYPTTPEFVDALFGVQLAGAIPVPLYPPVRLGRLEEYQRRTGRMLRASSARLVLADKRIRRLLGQAVAEGNVVGGCKTLAELPAGRELAMEAAGEDLALVQFSSGTTLTPKPVALSHRAVLGHAATLNSYWPENEREIPSGCSWLPLYHDMGLIGCLYAALERPGDLTLLPPELFVARPALWLRAISRYRATISPAPNFAYALAAERVREDELMGVDLSSWRIALNGAEMVVGDVLRRFIDRFSPYGFRPEAMTPVYGLSEAALAVTFSDIRQPFRGLRVDRDALSRGHARPSEDGVEIVSVGRPIRGVRLAIRDASGEELPERTVGRVWVESESMMSGYLDREEDTGEVLVDGWLDTGDLGFLLKGELFLTGRARDLLILRGRNHFPDEIEQIVGDVPEVRRGCVAAVSYRLEEDPGERLLLLVEHARGLGADRHRELAKSCREAVLARAGLLADEVRVLPPGALPRTSSGKIRRQEALKRWLEGSLDAPEAVTPLRIGRAMWKSRQALRRAAEDRDVDD